MATATFEFDEREYYRGLRAVQANNPYWWTIPVAGIVVPAVMIWLAIGGSWRQVDPWRAFLNVLPWLLLGAFYLSLMPMMARAAARKALQNDPALRGTQVRTVDGEGVHIIGAGFRQDLRWTDLVKVVETDEFFLFFFNKRQAHYVPKRALDAADIDEVRMLVRSNRRNRTTAAGPPDQRRAEDGPEQPR
jgi:hypothetical protein